MILLAQSGYRFNKSLKSLKKSMIKLPFGLLINRIELDKAIIFFRSAAV